MISINRRWPTLEYGPCAVEVGGEGWSQNQQLATRIMLDINLVQRQSSAGFFFKHANLKALVDTGSPYTIISRGRFEKAGFRVPDVPASNLHISGVVKRPGVGGADVEPSDDEVLWGWPDVPLLAYPFTLWLKLGLQKCTLKVMVAENVHKDQFLVGLDFLQHYPLLVNNRLLVLLGS
jgi:hypothetical protein